MPAKKIKVDRTTDLAKLKPDEQLKYEIAKELGLFDQVIDHGWKSLSAKETGKIGGIMTKRKKMMKTNDLEEKKENKENN